MGDHSERVYHIPGEDDKPLYLLLNRGDWEIILNALSLYCLWLKTKGTLPLEYNDVSPEQEKVLERLEKFDVTPKQLAIELKAGALIHSTRLRDLVEKEMTDDV